MEETVWKAGDKFKLNEAHIRAKHPSFRNEWQHKLDTYYTVARKDGDCIISVELEVAIGAECLIRVAPPVLAYYPKTGYTPGFTQPCSCEEERQVRQLKVNGQWYNEDELKTVDLEDPLFKKLRAKGYYWSAVHEIVDMVKETST